MEAARVSEGGGHVTHHNFFTILAVDEALADPTASPLTMTMFDTIDEDEGDSEVTTQTPANHAGEASSTEEHIHGGFNVLLLEGDITLPLVVSGVDYLEFLEKEVLPFPLHARNQRHKRKVLLKLERDLKVLPPPNPSIPELDFDISQWRHIIRELIKEMRVVESQCSLEIRNFGVYVLTSTPYNAFLEMLATHLAG